ncbi:hypothetical protein [Halorientalis halophila]|uniref:hypothetical protein n=1 Tax=Halorientalis halophila TaxID=3108499 RepID=UPI0030090FF9
MQRRAAAIYFALFLAIAVGSFAYINVVDPQPPAIDVEGEQLESDEFYTVGDQTYTVSVSEGSGELAWTNQSAQSSASLENGSTTTYQNESWTVLIENRTDVSEFQLREEFNVSALLVADDAVDDEPVDRNGEPHVVYTQNQSLQPLDEYLPAPQTQSFAEGGQYEYTTEEGAAVDATVSNVTTSAAELTWTAPEENTETLSEGTNVTLNGQDYVAHFPDNDTLVLSQDIESYMEGVSRQEYFAERINGIWGVFIVSFLTSIVLLGAAYLPVKD